MRTFTFSDAKSHKFWNIELQGNSFTVTYGRIGTAGQTQTKKFPSTAAAQKEHDKLIKEKQGKGYRETTPKAAASGGASLREALEAAILDNPEDIAAHMAYADYLQEQGDPRGEFIQVQLALEDESKSPEERKKLKQREKALLKKHQAEWVGDWPSLARSSGPEGRGQLDFPGPKPFRFLRGILAEATIDELTVDCARAFIRDPRTHFIRRLFVGGVLYLEAEQEDREEELQADDFPEYADYPSEHILLRWLHIANVRVFQLGWTSDEAYDDYCSFRCHCSGKHAYDFVKQMPRLEELYLFAHRVDGSKIATLPLPNLRVLQIYHSYDSGLKKLANNPSLGKVTHLLFHPHALDASEAYIRLADLRAVVNSPHLKNLTHLRLRLTDLGDKGCQEIVRSGILKRLKVLDLRHGCVSDTGAKMLADCPDLRHLEMLDLSRNELNGEGIDALKAVGIPVEISHQHASTADAEDAGDREYLFEGDIE
ncbi:MAG TPA: WGR domain-containing protein [Gemmataceae bacterium]|jgi:uncharacterized protein (TIGR02996 family)